MKTRTLYTEYVGFNPKDKKDIDYARVLATDRQYGRKNGSSWWPGAVVLPIDDDKITDWYEDEDVYLSANGVK
jgi:hypothetical protein